MRDLVKLEWPREGVAIVTLTERTPGGNLSWKGVSELQSALAEAREKGARVSVVASGLNGHFFEHAYLQDLLNMFAGKPTTGDAGGWFGSLKELSRTPVVTIAAIAGNTSGGGCELGWACDLRIAEEGVLFSQPEVIIGVGTGIGGTSRLVQLVGRTVASEMVLTGLPLTAERLYALGAVNRVVPKGKALAVALEIASHMATLPAPALAGMKRMLYEQEDLHLTAAINNDQKISQTLFVDTVATDNMKRIQARFDAGEPLPKVYWPAVKG